MVPPPQRSRQETGIPIPGGFNYSGGSDGVFASDVDTTHDQRIYFATYFQDDWKMTPSLTLNLGVRWDYFGPINESSGGQAASFPTRSRPKTRWAEIPSPSSGNPPRDLSTGHPSYLASDGTTSVPASAGTCNGIGCYGFMDLRQRTGLPFCRPNGAVKDWCRRKRRMLRLVSALPGS